MNHLDNELLAHIRYHRNNEALSLLQNNEYFCNMIDSKRSMFFCYAAKCDNTKFAQHLINLEDDVDAQNSFGETALMLAAQINHRPMVQTLLQSNADVFITDNFGQCVLQKINRDNGVTLRNQILQTLTPEYLIENKYFKSKDFHENYPLYNFIPSKNVNLTEFLLKNDSPINAKDPVTEKTSLHFAVESLDVKHVELLIKYRADVNVKDSEENIPLSYITDYENDEAVKIAKILIEAGTILTNGVSGKDLMKSILSNGNGQIIKSVLQTDIDLYTKTENSTALIEYLFENRNPDVYKVLRKFKIDLNKCTFMLLHRAASETNESLTKYLLECGVDVNLKDDLGRTALCMALNYVRSWSNKNIIEECWNCMELLFDYGADPQILTKENYHHVPGFSMPARNNIMEIMHPILAYLALYEVTGREIDSFMKRKINERSNLKFVFEEIKLELQEMKEIKIAKSLSLLDFIMTKRFSIFAGTESLIFKFIDQRSNSYSYYHTRKLQAQFLKLRKLIAINEFFIEFYNVTVINVAEKILGYL